MLFSRDKEDDDDFVPNPNYHSNLASIFGSSGSGGDNSSLTYTPPKQPKRQNKPTAYAVPPSSSSRSSSVLCAKTVQTFKLVDGSYQNQGKVGVAVVSFGSEESTFYQLLLYRDKQNHLCNTRITREFNFHIQPKNYCTFYDKQNVIWSILFDSPADMAELNLQVAKCRWKAEENQSPLLVQDLWCPVSNGDATKSSAAVGDTVELTYTLQTINNTSKEVGVSQRVVVEVESSGWKQALVGVQLNTQRVIILQPFMLGDLNPKEVVYNSPVTVQFTVLQVCKAPKTVPPADPPSTENQNQAKEVSKTQSVNMVKPEEKPEESPRSPKSSKADLINRMAKMGQALPFKKTVPTPSDSDETEEEHKTPVHRLGKVVPKPRLRVQHPTPSPALAEEGAVVEPPSAAPPMAISMPQIPVQWASGMQPYMVGGMYPMPQVNSPLESQSQFNMFLSEIRTTNSELRMGITRLTDKVEALQSKVDETNKKPPANDVVLQRLMEGEQHLKDQMQQILTALENAQLARQSRPNGEVPAQPTEQPAAQPTQPSSSASTSVQPCQQCAELHQAHTSLSEKMQKLQEENELLQVSLTAQKDALLNAKIADKDQLSRIETLQKQLCEEQKSVSELNQSLENLLRVKEIVAEDLQVAKNSIAELQNTLREKQTSIDRLEQALKDSEATKLEEVRRNLQEVLDPKPVIGEHVKKILNAVYRLVKVQFEPQNKYDSSFIQSVLAETIKAVTLEYLQNGELFVADAQQQALASARAHTPVATSQAQPQADSATALDQDKVKMEEVKGQYMNREERGLTDNDSKSSIVTPSAVTICSQPSSWATITTPNSNTVVSKEENHVEENTNDVNEKEQPPDSKPPVERSLAPNVTTIDSTDDSSDDVWRPQPPPPPLFDEEENDDDWFNT